MKIKNMCQNYHFNFTIDPKNVMTNVIYISDLGLMHQCNDHISKKKKKNFQIKYIGIPKDLRASWDKAQ